MNRGAFFIILVLLGVIVAQWHRDVSAPRRTKQQSLKSAETILMWSASYAYFCGSAGIPFTNVEAMVKSSIRRQ